MNDVIPEAREAARDFAKYLQGRLPDNGYFLPYSVGEERIQSACLSYAARENAELRDKLNEAQANYAECAVARDDWEGKAFEMQNERDALRVELAKMKKISCKL